MFNIKAEIVLLYPELKHSSEQIWYLYLYLFLFYRTLSD